MGSGSRPAPLPLGTFRSATSPTASSPRSTDTVSRSFSNEEMNYPPYVHSRKSSSGSASSASSKSLSRKPTSPSVNAHSYCGRHTDQFLFGGKSPFTDLWRSIKKKE